MKDKKFKNSPLYEDCFQFKERNSMFRFYVIVLTLFLLIIGTCLYFTTAFSGVEIDGRSMYPTLQHEQRLLMRIVDERHQADYGDIIVVHTGDHEAFEHEYIIKRLIAKEGDKVYCSQGQVYVQYGGTGNFVPLNEPYAYYERDARLYSFPAYTVGEGEIFFLGDNRQDSMDSEDLLKKGKAHCKKTDIYGIVPEWAIEHDGILELLFFSSDLSAK